MTDSLVEFVGLLGGLSVQQRACVVLRYVGGLSAVESGAVLDTSAATVRVQLHRAHATLRRTLKRLVMPDELDEVVARQFMVLDDVEVPELWSESWARSTRNQLRVHLGFIALGRIAASVGGPERGLRNCGMSARRAVVGGAVAFLGGAR